MEANISDSEPIAELPEGSGKTTPEDADSKTNDIVGKPEGSKDLINAILGEMKSEFNRDMGIVAKPEEVAAESPEIVPPAKDNGCKDDLAKTQVISNNSNDSGTKPKLHSPEVVKVGNNVAESAASASQPKVVESPPKDSSKSVIQQKDAIADILKDLPKILPKPSLVIPVLVTSNESKDASPVKDGGDVLPGKTCVTPGSEKKPRLVLTLKAGEDLSDGHKKQKSKGGNSHSGSDGVWTVKVDTDNQPQIAPSLTGKRSLRSQTVVKSPPEPEGVKRSARRRSKDLPRESVLQSAMARKEKSFSLGNEEKQSRAPRHRSLNRSLDKSLKPDVKKVPITKKTDILIIKPIKLEQVLPKLVQPDPPSSSSSSKPDKPDVPLLNTEITSSSTNFETDSAHSSSFGSTDSIVNGSQPSVSPIVSRPQASGSRIMLAIKSAPSSPGLAYSKTGKRRHKPFRGLKYSLNGVGINKRGKTPVINHSESTVVDDVSEDSVTIDVDGTDSTNGGNDEEDTPIIDESHPTVNSTSFLKRKLSGESDYFGGESGKRGRQDVVPSPSPADGNNLPSTPESTAISSGAGTAAICLCRTRSQLFVSNAVSSNGNDIYCQAVDSLDDRLVGCCNSIFGTEVRMMRPSQKVPFMILCNIHTERLLRHNCCPGCGTFCTQGKFMHCSSNHFYHRGCQLTGDICPHCGVDSPLDETHLYFKSHSNPVFVSQQKSAKKLPSAKMGFVGGSMDDTDTEAPSSGADTVLVLANGVEVSSQGLPPSLDKEKLESLLKIATTIPLNPAIRFSVKSLYQAAKSGNPERLLNVLASGQNPNHQFREGVTCLHLAAVSGNISSVHILVQAGAELDAMDRDQNTALMLATLTCNNGVIKYLAKAGASVTLKGSDGQTALHLAAKSGNLEACHYLLSVANVGRSYINSEDDGGWTPLVWAAEHCHVLVAKFLLDRRADPFVRDAEQNIALHWSAFSGCVDISELLLNYGCEVNCVNVHGDTPLHIGARQNMYHCVLLLLMRGARVDLKNKAGDSPLECCSVQPSDCYTVINLNKQLQNITRVAARRLLCNDISRGKETNPVQCVNNEDEEGEPTDFVYVSENCFTSNIVVDRTITSLQSCRCTHDLCTSADCKCGNVSLQCWYDPQGKLLPEFNFADPPMIFECNQGCACNRVTCHNRVVQHGLTSRFQLFRTREKGWGVRTLRNIEKGAYVCEYIGEIISDCEADQREDDSYLFDLDNRDGETYCIDARHYGNVARFINHMCVPNLMPVRVFIDHQDLHFPRIAFFANRDIAADEELGFDYGEKFWIIKCKSFTCTCGADTCRYSDVTIHQTLENYRRKQQLEETLVL